MNATVTELPKELLSLTESRPSSTKEFLDWCHLCYERLEAYELDDADNFDVDEINQFSALLVRRAAVFVRRYVDPAKADQMPRVGDKCVSHALIRLQECINWCITLSEKTIRDRNVIEVAYWDDLCVAVDLHRGNYYAITDPIQGDTFALEATTQLQINQGQIRGLLAAFAEHSEQDGSVKREKAHGAMPFDDKVRWRANKTEAEEQLGKAVTDATRKFKNHYAIATDDKKPPFSCNKRTDLVVCRFRVVRIRCTDGKTAETLDF